jgi:hypothetical protein
MRYTILLTILMTGCTQVAPVPESRELAEIKKALSGVGAIARQNDSTHSQLRDQSEKLERIIEKLDAAKVAPPVVAEDKPAQMPVSVDDDRPKLWVTYADFNCPPCERLKADVAAGKLDEFHVIVDAGEGLKTARPAIRFAWPSSATGYAVLYEYAPSTLAWLRANLLEPSTATVAAQPHTTISLDPPPVALAPAFVPFESRPKITKPASSHSDLVAMHNRLHGGGQWTWPGDLATHLRTTHGVNLGTSSNHRTPSSTSQRSYLGTVPQRTTYRGRSRTTSRSTRASCPTCPR